METTTVQTTMEELITQLRAEGLTASQIRRVRLHEVFDVVASGLKPTLISDSSQIIIENLAAEGGLPDRMRLLARNGRWGVVLHDMKLSSVLVSEAATADIGALLEKVRKYNSKN